MAGPGTGWRWARRVPFVVVAALSVWAAGRAPQGRRTPEFDWSLSGEAVLRALSKRPHIVYMLVLFLLAVLAVGVARYLWAAAMTVVVGVAWELAETTVVGQHPRLADLLPDLVGIAVGLLVVWLVAGVVGRFRRAGPPGHP